MPETPRRRVMLEVKDLSAGYGRLSVLRDVSITIADGALVGVLGPNGAGKTTLAKTISGLLHASRGSIVFDGRSIAQQRAQNVVRAGLVQVPQGRLLFPEMTVQENLEMGGYLCRSAAQFSESLNQVRQIFPILHERQHQKAGVMSGGEQQMLAIGRAMMLQPRLLILDEPSIGLAPKLIDLIFKAIEQINRSGTAVLLIEQNARWVLAIATYSYVLESGRVAAEGTSDKLLADDLVRRSYLGLH